MASLYTGPLYVPWNNALRFYERNPQLLRDWGTCISVLHSANFKLSFNSPYLAVYRGVSEKFLKIPESFTKANSEGFAGGVELGFMSTSRNVQVALEYALKSGEECTLFKINYDLASRGASVQFLSLYPYGTSPLPTPSTQSLLIFHCSKRMSSCSHPVRPSHAEGILR